MPKYIDGMFLSFFISCNDLLSVKSVSLLHYVRNVLFRSFLDSSCKFLFVNYSKFKTIQIYRVHGFVSPPQTIHFLKQAVLAPFAIPLI